MRAVADRDPVPFELVFVQDDVSAHRVDAIEKLAVADVPGRIRAVRGHDARADVLGDPIREDHAESEVPIGACVAVAVAVAHGRSLLGLGLVWVWACAHDANARQTDANCATHQTAEPMRARRADE